MYENENGIGVKRLLKQRVICENSMTSLAEGLQVQLRRVLKAPLGAFPFRGKTSLAFLYFLSAHLSYSQNVKGSPQDSIDHPLQFN